MLCWRPRIPSEEQANAVPESQVWALGQAAAAAAALLLIIIAKIFWCLHALHRLIDCVPVGNLKVCVISCEFWWHGAPAFPEHRAFGS
eukprot:1335765-Amphidinium_carterae.2